MVDVSDDSTPFDQLLLQWISEVETLPHHSVRRILQEELSVLDTEEEEKPDELKTRKGALQHALDALSLKPDPQNLRHAAISLTTTIDLSTLYSLLDTKCTLILMFETQRDVFHGIEDVIEELCEQQESILGLRADSSTRSDAATIVEGISPVQAWVRQPQPGMGVRGSRWQVGTLVTYFQDRERTSPLFSLQTLVSFTPDGRHVDDIDRVLLLQDTCVDIIQPTVHFGSFLAKKKTP
ncbi:unnamed protein product [Phytomonas sp. EM1]|nr:unnamed protein product [Phytomonas sp. EM1]|eukprot:CCW60169.1 unnamed protein product [Phytomonas sp. isolate EM1]